MRTLPTATRRAAADRIRQLSDFSLPPLVWLNSAPCARHATLADGHRQIPPCRRCGIRLRRHQRVGAAWLYMRGQGLLADQMGPQALDAQVLTPTGYRRMGDLQVGDPVIDPEGAPSAVAAIHPRGEQDLYRIAFSDGTWAESTLSHLWRVRGPVSRYYTRLGRELREGPVWHDRTLDEIRTRLAVGTCWKQAAVPLIDVAPDFAEAGPLPIDPYLLGLLLGDGSLGRVSTIFFSADSELIDAALSLLPPTWRWRRRKPRTGCEVYAMLGSLPIMRSLGLAGHRSWEKFIPDCYKWASAKTRLAVLQGLMDTDGSWALGSMEFSSTSPQLAQDVADIARSLGLRTTGPKPRQTYYTYNGIRKAGRPSFRVGIAETDDTRVFRLTRKLRDQPRERVSGDLSGRGKRTHWQRDQRVKWIRSIDFVRRAPVQCIQVSAASQLYVTDNWTVTHNTGKTAIASGLLALLKATGELDQHRCIAVVRPAVLRQWMTELARFVPRLQTVAAVGSRQQRVEVYLSAWHVLVVGFPVFVRDLELLERLPVGTLLIDDIDPLRNADNQTAYAIKRLARGCPRVAVFTGTPLQKRLDELHSVLEPVGGFESFGTLTAFRSRYLREEKVRVPSPSTGRMVTMRRMTGHKNLDEFIRKIRPLTLRRTARDIQDVDLPEIAPPNNVYLDLYPAQRARYEELRAGVLRIIKSEGTRVKRADAMAKFTYGAQICAGLATLGEVDAPGTSVKLDWLLHKLTGDLAEEKVVIFCRFLNTAAALLARVDTAGIGAAVIWGRDPHKGRRAESVERFWSDPTCRVLVGSAAIEQGLNLQVARHMICVDQLMNPARMQQLAGRIRRDGSSYHTVYVHNLLTLATQEEGYLDALAREQALADHVWSESNELYEALSPLALLQLIGGSARL